MSLKFSSAYQAGLWTGEMLRARCEVDEIDGLELVITGIEERTFRDVQGTEWVLKLGDREPEFRLKASQWQNGKALAKAFGDDGRRWVGQSVILKPRHVSWTDRQSGEAKEGWTIDLKPVLPPVDLPPIGEDLDDEIPF